MRLIILADVHGNWDALLALQRAEKRPDAVLFLGDAVGYGPEPGPCVDWLEANAAQAVQGDFDNLVAGGPRLAASDALVGEAAATAGLACLTLSAAQKQALAGWPLRDRFEAGSATLFLAHGTPADPLFGSLDLLTAPETVLKEAAVAEVVCLGQTHVPALRQAHGTLFVNPGSLGQPRYGTPDPTYAVWDDGRVQIHHLHYDPLPVCRKLAVLPLDRSLTARLGGVLRTGLLPDGDRAEEEHEADLD